MTERSLLAVGRLRRVRLYDVMITVNGNDLLELVIVSEDMTGFNKTTVLLVHSTSID
jgi:hypothetical protein